MKLELTNNVKEFCAVLDAASPIVTDTLMFVITPEAIKFAQVDKTKTTMMKIEIGKNFFNAYQVDKDIKIALPLAEFMKILTTFKGSYKNLIISTDDNTNKLILQGKEGRKSKKAEITKVELPDSDNLTENDIKVSLPTALYIPSTDFAKSLKDCESIHPKDANVDILLYHKDKDFKISTIAADSKNINEDSWNVADDLILLLSEESKSSYPMITLRDISNKGKEICERVQLSFGTELPLEIIYTMPNVNLKYYLAPILPIGED